MLILTFNRYLYLSGSFRPFGTHAGYGAGGLSLMAGTYISAHVKQEVVVGYINVDSLEMNLRVAR